MLSCILSTVLPQHNTLLQFSLYIFQSTTLLPPFSIHKFKYFLLYYSQYLSIFFIQPYHFLPLYTIFSYYHYPYLQLSITLLEAPFIHSLTSNTSFYPASSLIPPFPNLLIYTLSNLL